MVKRVFSILFVVVFVCCLAVVPALAVHSSNSGNVRYTPFAFSRINLGDDFAVPSAPWNCVDILQGVSVVSEDQREEQYFVASTTWENNQIVCRMTHHNLSYSPLRCTLEAEYLYFDSAEDNMVVMFPVNLGGSVTVSCNVLSYVLQNGEYVLIETPRSIVVNNFGTFVDVSYLLSSMAQSNGVVGFSDVRVTYESQQNYQGLWQFAVLTNGYRSLPDYQEIFIAKQDMRYTDSDTMDIGTFLVTSVGAFLDFQLIPGLSISGILGIIVTIALVFWFITLLV